LEIGRHQTIPVDSLGLGYQSFGFLLVKYIRQSTNG